MPYLQRSILQSSQRVQGTSGEVFPFHQLLFPSENHLYLFIYFVRRQCNLNELRWGAEELYARVFSSQDAEPAEHQRPQM